MNVSYLPVPPSNNPRALNRSIRKSIKTPLTMLLISLLLTTVARDTGLTCAKTEDTSHHVAETLLDLLKVSCEEVNALFLSTSNGSDITDDLVEAFAEAETLHEEAQAYFEAGEYDQAIDRTTKAMNLYGKVASKIYEIQGKDEEQNEDDEAEETFEPVELISYYEKSLDRLKRFKEITIELESQGVEVSETLALVLETELSLADMKENLEHGDFEKAKSMHRVVEDAFEEVEGGLQSQSHEKRKEKAEHFIDQTRQRVQQLETKYDKVLDKYDVSNDDTGGIHEEFQEILSALDEAEKDIDDDELDKAIKHLKDIVRESKDVGKDQEGLEDGLSENLNNLNEQDFILRTYLERIRMLEGFGIDTVELDDLLEKIERLLVDANKKINEGKNEDAEILIDDSDDLLDELDDLIDKLQEEEEKSEEETHDKRTDELTDDEDDTNDNKAEVDETEKEEDNEELDEDPPEANEGDEVDEKETEDDKTEKKSRKTEEKTRDNKTEDDENEEETDKAEDDESSHERGHRNHKPQKGRSKHS